MAGGLTTDFGEVRGQVELQRRDAGPRALVVVDPPLAGLTLGRHRRRRAARPALAADQTEDVFAVQPSVGPRASRARGGPHWRAGRLSVIIAPMRFSLPIFVILAASFVTACGDSIYGCNFTDMSRCQERTSKLPTSEAAFKTFCETGQGAYLTDGCPRDGIVGGCDITATGSGEDVVDWYYAPLTEAEVRMTCETESGTFTAP